MLKPSEVFDDPTDDEWADWLVFKLQSLALSCSYFKWRDIQSLLPLHASRCRRVGCILVLRKVMSCKYATRGKVYWIPEFQPEPRIKLTEKQRDIYNYIVSQIDAGRDRLTYRQIATESSVPYGSVVSAVDALRHKGFIDIEHAGTIGGNHGQVTKANRYGIPPHNPFPKDL